MKPSRKIGLVLLLGVFACDAPSLQQTQNCEIISHSPSNSYQLSYQLLLPSPCPAPLGFVGEYKTAAARIDDGGTSDFEFSEAAVRNAAGDLKKLAIDRFVVGYGVSRAEPRVQYPAATAQIFFDPNALSSHDQGTFQAFNAGQEQSPYNPTGTVDISYRQSPVSASIGGNDLPLANTPQTWTASVSGGQGAYTYRWYKDGVAVGEGASYTETVGTAHFGLKLIVSDPAEASAGAILAIDVGGVRAAISGPKTVYSSSGGTWTVTGRGGVQPYVFNWYVDNEQVGDGSSFSGYPGEGSHQLRVEMADAIGATHSATVVVSGIGDETCQPEPPAVTCGP